MPRLNLLGSTEAYRQSPRQERGPKHHERRVDLDQIYQKLTGIFRDVFDDDDIVVTPEMTALDVAEWDSLNHIRLILAVQKAFDVTFSAAQTAALQNVGELSELIRAKTAAA
jgi:acyl carrier protein